MVLYPPSFLSTICTSDIEYKIKGPVKSADICTLYCVSSLSNDLKSQYTEFINTSALDKFFL